MRFETILFKNVLTLKIEAGQFYTNKKKMSDYIFMSLYILSC